MPENKVVEKPVEDIPRLANILESNLEAHGMLTRVLEVNYHPHHLEFQLEFAQGIPIAKFEELSRDLALFLASPTGKVELVLPIPGTHRIGINLPRRTKKNQEPVPHSSPVETVVREKNIIYHIRNFLADIFFILVDLLFKAANALHQDERVVTPLVSSEDFEIKKLS